MDFKKLLELLEKGESIASPLSGIIGGASGILNMLGIGRKKQMQQQKEMVENAAQINYKYGEMAARNAFERQQVLYNRTYQDQSYANKVAQMDAAGLSPSLMYGGGGASGGGAGSTTGAPMGATGATGAGAAADPNAQLQALMSLRQVRMSERKNEAEINLLNTQADALKAEAGKNKEETTSIIEKRLWEVKQEMFKGWKGFIDTANQLWDQMVKWQPTKKVTIDDKEIEVPKYFEIEDDKFGKIIFGEESFQGDMMKAEKQILEGTAAIKTLESIYADEKLSAEIKKINADACSMMAQAAYYYAAGETQKAEAKVLEAKKRTEEATADLRELQYWTEIANTIFKLAQVVGNLIIGGKTGKVIREYTERKMSETPPKNSSTVTQHYDPEMQFKGLDKTVTTKW
nr:MAG TPA: DNA pilot protein [Microviridae sp.]